MNTNEDPGQTNKYIHNFLKVIVNLWVFAVQVFHLLFIFKHFHNKILGGGNFSIPEKKPGRRSKIKDEGKEGGETDVKQELK